MDVPTSPHEERLVKTNQSDLYERCHSTYKNPVTPYSRTFRLDSLSPYGLEPPRCVWSRIQNSPKVKQRSRVDVSTEILSPSFNMKFVALSIVLAMCLALSQANGRGMYMGKYGFHGKCQFLKLIRGITGDVFDNENIIYQCGFVASKGDKTAGGCLGETNL